MGFYLMGATASDGAFTNRSSTLPSFRSADLHLPLVDDECLILPDEQVAYGLDDVSCWHKGLLTSATCEVLLRTNTAGVLTDMTCCSQFLMCSPPGPLNPFPFLDLSVSSVHISGNMLFGITFSAAAESTTTMIFLGLLLSLLDQMIQSPDDCSSPSSSAR